MRCWRLGANAYGSHIRATWISSTVWLRLPRWLRSDDPQVTPSNEQLQATRAFATGCPAEFSYNEKMIGTEAERLQEENEVAL